MSKLVVDLFSCGGGASAGFARAFGFQLAAAVDLEVAKPSGRGRGETDCNTVYEANHNLKPIDADLGTTSPDELLGLTGLKGGETAVLISCAPCTDFSRANPQNHVADRERNSLVGRSGLFAEALRPQAFVMENARELITGNHKNHHALLTARLESTGMIVSSGVHMLSRFGLPQQRERALVLAARGSSLKTLDDLWEGWEVDRNKVTVRTALERLQEWQDLTGAPDLTGHVAPGAGKAVASRIAATPPDGGGWIDLGRLGLFEHMTPDCRRRFKARAYGSHPDVYGRMWWDRPAPTIKRECAHTGNGRYLHPELNRLMTVREISTLQGFPFDYRFPIKSVANRYRVIGDAVPPLIARQIAACVSWTLTGKRPEPSEWIMPNTSLRTEDLRRVSGRSVAVKLVA